jgi:AcrR family transcriptional regulator
VKGMDRVSRKRQERRERILEAAFTAIAENGPADFSLNQLARDLDYTPGALYWYFPSKEALVVNVQRMALAQLAQWLAAEKEGWERSASLARCKPDTRALSVLLRLAQYYLGLERTSPKHARIIAFSLDPRIWLGDDDAMTLAPVMGALFQPTIVAFHEAEQCGALEPGNARLRATQYWASLQGAAQTHKLTRIAPDLFEGQTFGMDMAETLLRGWGAAAKTLARARHG